MKLSTNGLMSLDIVPAKLSAEWLIGAGLPMAEPASPWWSSQPKRYVRSPQRSLPDLRARTGWHGDAQRTCAGRFHRLRHCRGRGMAQLALVSSAAGTRVLPDPVSRARPGSRIKLSRIRCNASALLVGGGERRIGAALNVLVICSPAIGKSWANTPRRLSCEHLGGSPLPLWRSRR